MLIHSGLSHFMSEDDVDDRNREFFDISMKNLVWIIFIPDNFDIDVYFDSSPTGWRGAYISNVCATLRNTHAQFVRTMYMSLPYTTSNAPFKNRIHRIKRSVHRSMMSVPNDGPRWVQFMISVRGCIDVLRLERPVLCRSQRYPLSLCPPI